MLDTLAALLLIGLTVALFVEVAHTLRNTWPRLQPWVKFALPLAIIALYVAGLYILVK